MTQIQMLNKIYLRYKYKCYLVKYKCKKADMIQIQNIFKIQIQLLPGEIQMHIWHKYKYISDTNTNVTWWKTDADMTQIQNNI